MSRIQSFYNQYTPSAHPVAFDKLKAAGKFTALGIAAFTLTFFTVKLLKKDRYIALAGATICLIGGFIWKNRKPIHANMLLLVEKVSKFRFSSSSKPNTDATLPVDPDLSSIEPSPAIPAVVELSTDANEDPAPTESLPTLTVEPPVTTPMEPPKDSIAEQINDTMIDTPNATSPSASEQEDNPDADDELSDPASHRLDFPLSATANSIQQIAPEPLPSFETLNPHIRKEETPHPTVKEVLHRPLRKRKSLFGKRFHLEKTLSKIQGKHTPTY